MIYLAAESLDKFDRQQRYAAGITVGVSQGTYEALCSEIELFRQRVIALVHADEEADRVCQFNIQLFPLSLIGRGER